jgi:hypothetical protein
MGRRHHGHVSVSAKTYARIAAYARVHGLSIPKAIERMLDERDPRSHDETKLDQDQGP